MALSERVICEKNKSRRDDAFSGSVVLHVVVMLFAGGAGVKYHRRRDVSLKWQEKKIGRRSWLLRRQQ